MLADLTRRPSALVLVLANLIPLVGVIFWDWSVFNIVVLYWMENLVIGVINILKMVTCRPDLDEMGAGHFIPDDLPGEEREQLLSELKSRGGLDAAMRGHSALKLFTIPFFMVHYFGFCAVHGIFVFTLFGRDAGISRAGSGLFSSFAQIPALLTGALGFAALSLVLSHLYSFFTNYLGAGEYRRTVLPVLMFQPYGRIVVLHVAIIFGGFLVMSLGSPIGLLVILILGKIVIDLKLHLWEHGEKRSKKWRSPLLKSLADPAGRRQGR
ncbi:MAG: DUF6498-containing protein [Verrucomicrobiales bacterium]